MTLVLKKTHVTDLDSSLTGAELACAATFHAVPTTAAPTQLTIVNLGGQQSNPKLPKPT